MSRSRTGRPPRRLVRPAAALAVVTVSAAVTNGARPEPIAAAEPTPGCVVDTDGVIGWWRGEDDLLAVVGPTLTGDTAYGDGAVGRGFRTDVASLAATSVPGVSTAISVEAWVRTTAPASGSNQAIVTRWDFPSTDDSARSWSLVLDPYGNLVWSIDDVSSRRPIDHVAPASSLLDGQFHHVAATWDQQTATVYVDGVAVGTGPSRGGLIAPAASTPVRIGAKSGLGSSFAFQGIVDEPTVWGRALDAGEVAAIAAAGLAGKCSFIPVEQGKFVPDPGPFVVNGRFGQSVGVSGTTVVAGSPYSSLYSQFGGALYVYTSADGITWSPQATVLPDDPARVDYVGWSVAIDGDTVVTGSYGNNAGGVDSGAAYVFRRTAGVWSQEAKLLPAAASAGDGIGYDVAIDGDTVVIGAPAVDGGLGDAGAVHVFTRTGSTWTEEATLVADDAAALDNFGASVAIDGDVIVVGSPGSNETTSLNTGAAYVFTRAGGVWTQQARLTMPAPVAGDQLGASVAIDGAVVAVGVPYRDGAAGDTGAVAVFDGGVTGWPFVVELAAGDGEAGDRFGFSVAVQGARLVVGVDREGTGGDQRGAAYLFDRAATTWTQTTKLLASDLDVGDQFGYDVAIAGRVVVGSHLDDDRGNNAGAAYVFGP